MKTSANFTTQNVAQLLSIIQRRRTDDGFQATILAYAGTGSWGGGTLAYYLSPDGGTTLIPLKDLSGNAITSNADDNVNVNLGNSSHNNDRLQLWGKMTGGTSSNITVAVYDNN
jgi:hypothetical protein